MADTLTINRDRMVETAVRLIEVPSRTGDAGAVSNRLAELLAADGFSVRRVAASHDAAPAVVVGLDSGKPGPTLQFDGHLDTVHLPFVPPHVAGPHLTGSGAADMKGGVACAVEALRALRDANTLSAGSVLLTAHDLHEAPWGFGQQLDAMIRDGLHGDAVLIPEPLTDHLPTVGRGNAVWKVHVFRPGEPVHEVMRPLDEPNVIAAAADLVGRLMELAGRLAQRADPEAGLESLFVGQLHAGEIYNQYPQQAWLEGTRRWLPETDFLTVESEFRHLLTKFERDWEVGVMADFHLIRHAFRLKLDHPIVATFERCFEEQTGRSIPRGPKAFVDDGNSFWRLADVPAITHGPKAGGQHTVHEWVEIDDMARVAELYARTAVRFCKGR